MSPTSPTGSYERTPSIYRELVVIEPERHRLYVSLACPWAHRTIVVRRLSGLDDVIPLSIIDPVRDERGWAFDGQDEAEGWSFLSEAYFTTDPGYPGKVTVPVLWDAIDRRVVNNESADIVLLLNDIRRTGDDLYPPELRPAIDELNAEVYRNVNDGVYKCGFARSQEAYAEAFGRLFGTLDRLDALLGESRFLVADRPTIADWRLFTTLLRFDAVYYLHFKCNLRRVVDYPNLWPYARSLYQVPGVAGTVDWSQIKRHYYVSHRHLNPYGIVPGGPAMDWDAPHGR